MKKILGLLIILAAICIGAVYMLPSTLNKVLETELSKVLETQVKVNGIDFSLINGTFTISDVTVKDYPEFSEGNLLNLKNINITVLPSSLMRNLITLKDITVESLDIYLTGNFNNNSIKLIKHHLSEAAEFDEHSHNQNETTDHHHHNAVKFKINEVNLAQLAINVKITEPFELDNKQVIVKNTQLTNITDQEGSTVIEALGTVFHQIDNIIITEIANIIPAQKVYEDAESAVYKGVEKSRLFFEQTFNNDEADEAEATELTEEAK